MESHGRNELLQTNDIETRLFINGVFTNASSGDVFELKSPTTLQVVANVPEASVDDVNAAVAAAKAAQPKWAALSPAERGAYFTRLAALLREASSELAYLEAISMGRPVGGYTDATNAAAKFEYFAQAGYLIQGRSSLNTPGFVNMTIRQPFGVAAVIIPWNVPLSSFAGKVAPALAAGNTVVIKSSEKAPLTSIKMATLIQKAGFPPGVVNVLSGHGSLSGAALASHMDVRVISFTGSLRTGRIIQELAAKSNMKNVVLELGGKSPAIILDDADLELAATGTSRSITWNSGQVCMANSRVYVHEAVYDKFVALFKEKLLEPRLGDPLAPTTTMGPVADGMQFESVNRYLRLGQEEGQPLILHEPGDAPTQGYFVHPAAFTDTPDTAAIMKEEIFGPVTNINRFQTDEEALEKANDSEYGLYASIYTRDLNRALKFAQGFEAGTVGVNCTSPTLSKDLPFGGYKSSGLGREGLVESMESFLETKTVLIRAV